MFRSWSKEVKSLLKDKDNRLVVSFYPYDSLQTALYDSLSPKFPEKYVVSRKAAYQHGWDWAPKYKNIGIWKPVKLSGWTDAKINYATIVTDSLNDKAAFLKMTAEVKSTVIRSMKLQVFLDGRKLNEAVIDLDDSVSQLSVPFIIDHPNIWWPNEMGEQHLYDFEVKLMDGDEVIDGDTIRAGIRKVELICQPDSIGTGFYFQVNGVPMYAKGANFIPEDNFTSWMKSDNTQNLLLQSKEAHFNMLRIWGGGIYPPDYFYDICDSLGILVWQDFMFAGSTYPYSEAFLQNVEQEAKEQVVRFASHPSLALWCGNNEISEGYYNWGWQNSLNWTHEEDSLMKAGYDQLFEIILKDVVANYDGSVPYWPSSPSKGWGRKESLTEGDVHYWGVWWGEQPFEMYKEKVGRFNSEFGYQAYPDMSTLRKLDPEAELRLGSPLIAAHQKHARGEKLIDDHIRKYFPYPEDFGDYVYMSQLSQAFGVGLAIEAQRFARPQSMGSLYWQLNDSWPVVSWSSIDYYGKKKALQYHLNTLYAPVLIGCYESFDNNFVTYISNDLNHGIEGRIKMGIFDMNGNTLFEVSKLCSVDANQIVKYHNVSKTGKMEILDFNAVYVRLNFVQNDSTLAERFCYFVDPKDLNLLPLNLEISTKVLDGKVYLELNPDVLAKNICLYTDDVDGDFSDNYFDLAPKETKTVVFTPSEPVNDLDAVKFNYRVLNKWSKQKTI
jgi:Beta-galactosidase/beta-glucuronidase